MEKKYDPKVVGLANQMVNDMTNSVDEVESRSRQMGYAMMNFISLVTFSILMISLFVFLYFYIK